MEMMTHLDLNQEQLGAASGGLVVDAAWSGPDPLIPIQPMGLPDDPSKFTPAQPWQPVTFHNPPLVPLGPVMLY